MTKTSFTSKRTLIQGSNLVGAAKQLWQNLPLKSLNKDYSRRMPWVHCQQLLGYGRWKIRWSAEEQFTWGWHLYPSSCTSHNPVAINQFFPPSSCAIPFFNLAFQQHFRPCQNLNVSQFTLQFKQALITKVSSQLSSSVFIHKNK